MFVHVQQLRYLPKHLGRVSCLVGNTRVSTAVDGNSGESADAGRLHLHVFMEFGRAVDWSTLRPVCFHGICPNAQPTQGRGAKQREVVNHGHFYVFAQKAALTDC